MNLTDEQQAALEAVDKWYRSARSTRFRLDGYAGTGKTTLAQHFANLTGKNVRFCAFTGKAASVLRAKGCSGATTIHSLIYRPTGGNKEREEELAGLIEKERQLPSPDETKIAVWQRDLKRLREDNAGGFKLRDDPEIRDADLVIVDESSMVTLRMAKDIESFGKPVLYLGDPGQLPPVYGKAFLQSTEPDFMLKEIHRQAAESPIIQLATKIRNGESAAYGRSSCGKVVIARKSEFDWAVALEADQMICGTNATRRRLNAQVRKRLGRVSQYPEAADKLICLQNNHDEGLLNGVFAQARPGFELLGTVGKLPIIYEGQERRFLVDPGHFEEHYDGRVSNPRRESVEHFDYGYAVTGHKSQGSQWPHVLICDDRFNIQDRLFRQRWLYTVVTRAEERLTIYV